MPIKLIPPRQGKTPYWAGRGTYLGVYVDRSTKAGKRAVAAKIVQSWERDIERGSFSQRGEPTFGGAAAAYIKAGGERRFLPRLIEHFKDTPLREIDQTAIDGAAATLLPTATAATRNRQVYTPASAVLRHVKVRLDLARPKGSEGRKATAWLWPEQAAALFDAAGKLDAEFGTLLIVLCYTGLRLSEALGLQVRDVRLADAFAYIPDSKNEEPRPIFLPPVVVAALASHPRGMEREGPLFRLRKNGHIYSLLRAAAARADVDLPVRTAFHIFCHTYATWMRRYGGLDTKGLVATGRWKDRKSVDRYEHVVIGEDARRAELLPTPKMEKVRKPAHQPKKRNNIKGG